jgi:hypothetical protein
MAKEQDSFDKVEKQIQDLKASQQTNAILAIPELLSLLQKAAKIFSYLPEENKANPDIKEALAAFGEPSEPKKGGGGSKSGLSAATLPIKKIQDFCIEAKTQKQVQEKFGKGSWYLWLTKKLAGTFEGRKIKQIMDKSKNASYQTVDA